MRRTIADFRKEATKEPFELELGDGTVFTVKSPNDLPIEDQIAGQAWYPGSDSPSPLEMQLRCMTGDHYEAFWSEWKREPRYVLEKLVTEVETYYAGEGGDGGKAPA